MCNAKQSDDHFNVEFRAASTVSAEAPWQCKLEFNTDKIDDVTSEMQVEQNSLSFSPVSGQ